MHSCWFFAVFIFYFSSGQSADIPPADKIAQPLQSLLKSNQKVNILITFEGTETECRAEQKKNVKQSLKPSSMQRATLKNVLMEKRNKFQQGVKQLLITKGLKSSNFSQFWVTNQIVVDGADSDLVQAISKDPLVTRIEEEPTYELLVDEDLKPSFFAPDGVDEEMQWNLQKMQVPEAWNELGGNKGEGIVIGILDTGVRATHEILKDNFIGKYGWFDAFNEKKKPYDHWGHGTSVAGIAVGSKGFGVAPGAKWSACKASDQKTPLLKQRGILRCSQFFICPTLPDGTNPDCTKAPDIINNSWGEAASGSTFFNDLIACWQAAGIIPIFGGGNKEKCGSVEYPAEHPDIISVGNYKQDGTLNKKISSKGPGLNGVIKPDICAPGTGIMTAFNRGDLTYKMRKGTSFAAPHVTGAISLVLGQNNTLDFGQIRELLQTSTDKVGDTWMCKECTENCFPNNEVGYGNLNAFEFVKNSKKLKAV